MRAIWRSSLNRTMIVLIVLTAGTLLPGASPARADHAWPINKNVRVEQDYGVLSTRPDNLDQLFCVSNPYATACYQEYGDVWYVRDNASDGYSADALWEDYTSCDSWTCVMWRQGICRNLHGEGTWARCNKNYYETHLVALTAGASDGWHVTNYDSRWIWVYP